MQSPTKLTSSDNSETTLLVLTDSTVGRATLEASLPLLEGKFTVWHIHTGGIPATDLHSVAQSTLSSINQIAFKRSTLVTINGASNLATVMLAMNAQCVRRAIFIDPPGRPRPGLFTRFREKFQRFITIPMPFQLDPDDIDLRHIQHRISCPLLVLQSPNLDSWWAAQCRELCSRAPSSWLVEEYAVERESPTRFTEAFISLVLNFIEVPAKRSQKNLRSSAGPVRHPAAVSNPAQGSNEAQAVEPSPQRSEHAAGRC